MLLGVVMGHGPSGLFSPTKPLNYLVQNLGSFTTPTCYPLEEADNWEGDRGAV